MNHDKLKIMISEYFDDELDKNKEASMFSLLSGDEENREFFKQLNRVKGMTDTSVEEFPFELEERIVRSVQRSETKPQSRVLVRKVLMTVPYIVTVILFVLSLLLFSEVKNYKAETEMIHKQVRYQSRIIRLMINALPTTEIEADFTNEIIVEPIL